MRQHDLVAVRDVPPPRHPLREGARFHATVRRNNGAQRVRFAKMLVAIAAGLLVAGAMYRAGMQP